mgnify:CR=1 FL=1
MKEKTTFTLTPEVKRIIRKLATSKGISMSAIIELAVRLMAKRDGVE